MWLILCNLLALFKHACLTSSVCCHWPLQVCSGITHHVTGPIWPSSDRLLFIVDRNSCGFMAILQSLPERKWLNYALKYVHGSGTSAGPRPGSGGIPESWLDGSSASHPLRTSELNCPPETLLVLWTGTLTIQTRVLTAARRTAGPSREPGQNPARTVVSACVW